MQSAPPARATHPAPRARQALTDFTLMADAPTPGQLLAAEQRGCLRRRVG